MNLQLKHLAPYFTCNISVDVNGIIFLLVGFDLPSEKILALFLKDTNGKTLIHYAIIDDITGLKPILRPLSDINKQFPGAKNGYTYLDEINSHIGYKIIGDEHCLEYRDVGEFLMVFDLAEVIPTFQMHHFDTFDLINQGLAIDINKL